jgi:CPA2 family monovalent cation:H+ antiporter-2
LVVALTMLLTPFLFIIYDKLVCGKLTEEEKKADTIDEQGSVIIAGHGRFGQVINRILLSSGIKTVVLDHQSTLVEGMRKFGVKTFFGDASRPDLLHSAGLSNAKLLIITIDDHERAIEMVKFARRERSDIHIIVRAYDRHHVYELYSAGANDIVRETFDSAVRAGKYSLMAMGNDEKSSDKTIDVYVDHDRSNLIKLARIWEPGMDIANNEEYKSLAKENQQLLLAAIQALKNSDKEQD